MAGGWRHELAGLTRALRSHVRAGRRRVLRSLGADDPYQIVVYRGHGNPQRVYVHGRVLENEGITPAGDADSTWRNIVNTFKRLESDPLPFARVRVRVPGGERELAADDEGFFSGWIDTRPGASAADRLWHAVDADLVAPSLAIQSGLRGQGLALIPPPAASFGVISDLDDTVIQSHVTSFLRAARTLLIENSRTRLPFPGVAAFYRALTLGARDVPTNPIFYVSSSPWNLYDLLEEFLDLQGIPAGPLLLRDWDLDRATATGGHHGHKSALIRDLLASHPTLPFILIGDSGQEDPEIYRDIVHEHPDRILAVYIRNVSRNAGRTATIRALADELVAARSSLVLADDTLAAARHAAEHGWIPASALREVTSEKKADEGVTDVKAPAPGVPKPEDATRTVVVDGSRD
jgi:phosphatidate phosphatase APP1